MVNRPGRHLTRTVAYLLLGQSMLRAKQDGDYVMPLQYIEVTRENIVVSIEE